jgi:transcriptional regulator with PAS, ATPase and Fis domain
VATRASLAQARQDFEARFVRAALARAGGSVMLAARELGISRQGLTKLTVRLGLDGHR